MLVTGNWDFPLFIVETEQEMTSTFILDLKMVFKGLLWVCSNELGSLCAPPFHNAFQMNIQGRMLFWYEYTKRGNLRFIYKEWREDISHFQKLIESGKYGRLWDAKGRVHFPLVMCLIQGKLNELEKDLTYKLELPVQMYELQVNRCSSLK